MSDKTAEQLTEIVELVCSEMGISPPRKLVFTEDSSGGAYWPHSQKMQLCTQDPIFGLNCIDVALHEAAHHITDTIHGTIYASPNPTKCQKLYGYRRRRVVHGQEFQETLREIAEIWYGDASEYGWEWEYKSINKAAHKRGWSKAA